MQTKVDSQPCLASFLVPADLRYVQSSSLEWKEQCFVCHVLLSNGRVNVKQWQGRVENFPV